MIFTTRKKYWFAPDIKENLKLPESRQLKGEIIRPSEEVVGELTTTETVRKLNSREMLFRTKVDKGRILREHVGKLLNCETKDADTGETIQITTGAELAECSAFGIRPYVEAFCNEVLKTTFSEELKKKSESECSLSSTDGPGPNGTAT